MTDLERWRALLRECGVSFTELACEEYEHQYYQHPKNGRAYTRIHLEEGNVNTKVAGWSGFYISIKFDNEDGSLIEIGAWE